MSDSEAVPVNAAVEISEDDRMNAELDAISVAAVEIVSTLRHLVNHKDALKVVGVPTAKKITVNLYTDRADVGQVIGRAGHIMSSVRSLLAALSGKHRIIIELDYQTEFAEKRRHGAELHRKKPTSSVTVS